MLSCSSCLRQSEFQCNSCNGMLLCTQCSSNHITFHQMRNSYYSIEKVSIILPVEKLKALTRNINKSLDIIEKQREDIAKSALIVINQVKKLVSSSCQQLESIANEYTRLLKLKRFQIQDLMIVEEIIEKTPLFLYPQFSSVEGDLLNFQQGTPTFLLKILQSDQITSGNTIGAQPMNAFGKYVESMSKSSLGNTPRGVSQKMMQGVMPEPIRGGMAVSMQGGPMQGGMPGPIQGATPRPMQGGMQGKISGPMQGSMPIQGSMPGPIQGGMPGHIHGGMPGPIQNGMPGPMQGLRPATSQSNLSMPNTPLMPTSFTGNMQGIPYNSTNMTSSLPVGMPGMSSGVSLGMPGSTVNMPGYLEGNIVGNQHVNSFTNMQGYNSRDMPIKTMMQSSRNIANKPYEWTFVSDYSGLIKLEGINCKIIEEAFIRNLPSTKFIHEQIEYIIIFGCPHFVRESENTQYLSIAKRLDKSSPLIYKDGEIKWYSRKYDGNFVEYTAEASRLIEYAYSNGIYYVIIQGSDLNYYRIHMQSQNNFYQTDLRGNNKILVRRG